MNFFEFSILNNFLFQITFPFFRSSFNKTMDCIDKQLRKCGNPLHKELWLMFTLTLQDYFRQDICFDTPFRKGKLIKVHSNNLK